MALPFASPKHVLVVVYLETGGMQILRCVSALYTGGLGVSILGGETARHAGYMRTINSSCYWCRVGESSSAKIGGIRGSAVQCDKPMLSTASWQCDFLSFRGACDFRGEGGETRTMTMISTLYHVPL